MDRLKNAAKHTRDKISRSPNPPESSSGTLAAPHASLPPGDAASTIAVNEGYLGPSPGTAVRDYAVSEAVEPPTSLQSSVDANKPLPNPPLPSNADAARIGAAGPSRTTPAAPRVNVPNRRSSITRPGDNRQAQPRRPTTGTRQPSIGIRRSGQNLRAANALGPPQPAQNANGSTLRPSPSVGQMPTLAEEGHDGAHGGPRVTGAPSVSSTSSVSTASDAEKPGRWKKARLAMQSRLGFKKQPPTSNDGGIPAETEPFPDYNDSMVDVLDTLDPEISTLTSLTNVQNSLFIPSLGRFVNRRPTYVLRSRPANADSYDELDAVVAEEERRRKEGAQQLEQEQEQEQEQQAPGLQRMQTMETLRTIDSRMSDSRFAVLPHGTSLEGWSKEDKAELNDHVRHMLHSRRSKFKRSMKGFGQYVRRPLGFLVTLYATLITLFGLAWVLFLIGWISVGSRQLYIINVIDNVLVALFALVGDGLAPFRAIDTYHMIFIAHYHHYTWSRRKKDMLPDLHDHNDLPATNAPFGETKGPDPEDPEGQYQYEYTVLTPKQQAKLEHHQQKYSKSHTFYKPHETETHFAFPLRLLIAIQVLLDCHSLFQIALGTCTWSIYYKRRPFALTTVILICSISCNATAGLLIWIGDIRTRKKDVLERMNRQELTEEAIDKMEKKWEKEEEKARESDAEIQSPGEGPSKESWRKSFDIARKSTDLKRKSMDKSRKSTDVERKSMDKGRRSLNLKR